MGRRADRSEGLKPLFVRIAGVHIRTLALTCSAIAALAFAAKERTYPEFIDHVVKDGWAGNVQRSVSDLFGFERGATIKVRASPLI